MQVEFLHKIASLSSPPNCILISHRARYGRRILDECEIDNAAVIALGLMY
jgi:hypothetical protein